MNNDGKYLEGVVKLIERSLNTESKIEQNVQMPVLTSKIGATTECDIVITTGVYPRQTITIIEVQDRTKKPALNDFRGWQKKLEQVGAQHLICVSKEGFTESEIELACQSGNTIRLMKITSLDVDTIPMDFFEFKGFRYTDFEMKLIHEPALQLSMKDVKRLKVDTSELRERMSFPLNDKRFSLDGETTFSMYDICKSNSDFKEGIESGISRIDFISDENPLYYVIHGKFIRTKLTLEYSWWNEYAIVPASLLSYDQHGFGPLAWLLEAGYNSKKGFIGFKIPVVKNPNGDGYILKQVLMDTPQDQTYEISIISE
jgi:hypothetical protein